MVCRLGDPSPEVVVGRIHLEADRNLPVVVVDPTQAVVVRIPVEVGPSRLVVVVPSHLVEADPIHLVGLVDSIHLAEAVRLAYIAMSHWLLQHACP